jgi:hypothetical protein
METVQELLLAANSVAELCEADRRKLNQDHLQRSATLLQNETALHIIAYAMTSER